MSSPTQSIPASDKQVLLAVDDDASGDLLEHRMSRRGLSVVRVANGGAVRSNLRSRYFALVVIENRLPGLTGLELLRRVPTGDVRGSPTVVLLGQTGNNEEVVRAFELGAAEYIARPFAPEIALARILRFLGTRTEFVSRPPSTASASLALTPTSLLGTLDPLSVLIGTTTALLGLAVVFAVVALIAHLRALRRSHWENRLRETWREDFFDVLAGDTEPKVLLDRVTPGEDRIFLRFLMPYAARFEDQTLNLIRRLAAPSLSRIEDDLDRPRPGTRARTVQLFGLLGDDSCRGLLRRSLDDPSPLVVYTAFRWLCRRGTPDDLDLLIDHLDDLERVDRNQLSSWLLQLGPDAAPGLRAYLADADQRPFVRLVCAETLRWMGDSDAGPLAAQLLADEAPPELTAALLRLLRRVGCPDHALLVRSYCNSDVPFVQIHAARALGQIGHPDHDQALLHDLVAGADSRWVAFNAAKSLTELGQTTPLLHLSQSRHDRAPLAESMLAEPQ